MLRGWKPSKLVCLMRRILFARKCGPFRWYTTSSSPRVPFPALPTRNVLSSYRIIRAKCAEHNIHENVRVIEKRDAEKVIGALHSISSCLLARIVRFIIVQHDFYSHSKKRRNSRGSLALVTCELLT